LFFQRNDNRAYANVTLVPGARYQFRLQKEGVTNVGTLSASYDISGRNSFSLSNGYDTVKREFLETFSRSPWSTATWNEVSLYPYSG
jgi:hypothetical protein